MLHRVAENLKHKVWIVDDDMFFGKLLKNYLIKYEISIDVFGNGEEALVEIESGSKPDLMVLDMIMPKMDGFDTLESLKESNYLDFSKIIVVTSLSQEQDKETVKGYGVKDYLVKTEITIQELAELVNNYL